MVFYLHALYLLPQEAHFLIMQNTQILLTHFQKSSKLTHFAGVHDWEAAGGSECVAEAAVQFQAWALARCEQGEVGSCRKAE